MFNWQTQNSVSKGSDILNRYIHSDVKVSLYVRINRKENSNVSPYMYLGEATYVSNSASKPATIIWNLKHKILFIKNEKCILKE